MEKKPDRRVARTRQALMSAFVGELLARGFDAVSVEDIARRADVGRSTFYMHYRGKEDLLREAVTRPSTVLALVVGGNIDAEMVAPQLAHFHAQRGRNGSFFRDPIRRIWVDRLAEMIEPRLARLACAGRPLLPQPLIARQLAETQLALLINWLTQKPALKPEVVAQALIANTQGQLRALLGLDADAPIFLGPEKLKVIYREP